VPVPVAGAPVPTRRSIPVQRQKSPAIAHFVASQWSARAPRRTMAATTTPSPVMNARRRLLAASLALLGMPALAASREVRGSGRIVTERRAVTGFDRLAIAGDFEVELHQGDREGVEIVADDDLLPLIETVVGGRDDPRTTLRISPRRDVELVPTQPIRIRVDLVRLGKISLAGSAHVKANGLRSDRLELSLGGSGDIALAAVAAERVAVHLGGSGRVAVSGRTAEAVLNIAGSGHAGLAGLAADDVSVSLAGSGAADVHAERNLKVSIAGSGRVRHGGAAQPVVSIVGSGDVRRL